LSRSSKPRSATFRSLLLGVALLASACSRPPNLAADLVVTHGAVWTGDAARPQAEAVAVIGGRIVDVGSSEEIERWRGPNTQVVDAGGRRVIPGFNDAHVHFASGGAQLTQVDLRDVTTQAEFARRIIARARSSPNEWILGGQWDERTWTVPALPTRSLIDDGTNGTPVLVMHADGRTALANAAALGRAGITESTPDPVDGAIVRDDHGMPTGVLKGSAIEAVTRVVPKPTDEQRRRTIARALDQAASFGVTSVQDVDPDPADVAVYTDLAQRGDLTTRIYVIANELTWFEQARLGVRRAFGSTELRLGAVAGDATSSGASAMLTRLMAADHAGLQICLGYPGVEPLDAIARANGDRDRRFRIEHAEKATPTDADRLASLHAVVSVRAHGDADAAALKGFLDRRIRMAIMTNWPAAPINPLLGIATASARIPVDAAVTAYTSGAAFAEFQDAVKGTVARGMVADLVILSDDIFAIPRDRIRTTTVLTTIANGKVVHQRRP